MRQTELDKEQNAQRYTQIVEPYNPNGSSYVSENAVDPSVSQDDINFDMGLAYAPEPDLPPPSTGIKDKLDEAFLKYGTDMINHMNSVTEDGEKFFDKNWMGDTALYN